MIDRRRHRGAAQTAKETLALADAYDDPRPRIQDYAYEPAQEQGLDILHLFLYAVLYRWLLATLAAAGLASSLAVTMMMTPKYAATAQLEVLVPSAKVFQDIELTSESSDVRSFLTASEKLKSRSVAQRVVFNLGLSERADFLFPKASFSPVNILNRAFGISDRVDISKYSAGDRARMAVDRVLANLSVVPITNTSLLSITYSDQQPRYAYEIANQAAQSFIDQRVDQANTTSVQVRKFIQERVLQAKEQLQQSEQSLVDYAKKAGITLTGNDYSLIASNLTEINAALARAIQENLDYGRLVQQIDNGQGASLEQILKSEPLEKMRSKLSELDADYQQKLGLFKPDFPEMQQIRSQMRTIESQLNQGIQAITDSIRLKHRETLAKVDDLKKKLSELQTEQVAYQDKNIQYTILKREADSNRSQYESLIAKLNEIAIGSKLKDQNAAVVDLAVLPRSPFSPRLSLNIAIGLALSMMLGAATIYVLELLNNTFVDPEQIERELRLPILGIVPAVDEREMGKALADSKSGLSESYRSLRTSLQFSGDQGVPRVLLVASSIPSEGKSTTVRKLAEDFAALGAKVLAIDADLRKPTLHRAFKIDNDVGLSNVLTSTIRRDDLPKLVKRANADVNVMTAGIIPPNPADLLSSPRMGLLLQKLSKTYDIIIIDSAPVIGLSDAPILSRLADTTLLVVSSTQVTRKAARAALKRIQAAGANVVGVAFTKFSPTKFGYSNNYKNSKYYYYSYGNESPKIENKVGEEAAPEHAKNWSFADVSGRLHGYLRNAVDRIKLSS